jgi:hypothetical protein
LKLHWRIKVPEWSDVIKVLAGVIAGFAGGFSLKAILVKQSYQINTKQKGNVVGGHQAGGDVNVSGEPKSK